MAETRANPNFKGFGFEKLNSKLQKKCAEIVISIIFHLKKKKSCKGIFFFILVFKNYLGQNYVTVPLSLKPIRYGSGNLV